MKNAVDRHLASAIAVRVSVSAIMAGPLPMDTLGSWDQVEIAVIILESHYETMSTNSLACHKRKTFDCNLKF